MKLLVCGRVNGSLAALHDRVAALNASAHGPFDAVFIVGGVFAASSSDGSAESVLGPFRRQLPCRAPVATPRARPSLPVSWCCWYRASWLSCLLWVFV
jgi:hypothetical protein